MNGMMPQDFYHRALTVGLFFKLLLFGLLSACLGLPLASFMHALGHALFGMAAGCRWIGLLIPFSGHAQPLVNLPSAAFPASAGFAWFAMGGFLWVGVLLAVILFFPTDDTLLQNLFLQVLGFHLAFWGFFQQAMALWPGGAMGLGGVPAPSWTDPVVWLPAGAGGILSLLFAVRTVRILGQGVHCTFFTPVFLSLALWFAPAAAVLTVQLARGAAVLPVAVLGATALAALIASPFFGTGPRLWKEPAFAPWIYGLALTGAAAMLAAVLVLGWGRGPKPILWGDPAPPAAAPEATP